MSYTKTIVCLANSRKPPSGGRCVAGREVIGSSFGAWIRPVSARATREISEEERRYDHGADPVLLDVIAIPMTKPEPHDHQQENHVIDDGYIWAKRGSVSWDDIQAAVEDPGGILWLNGYSSTYGENDRVPEAQLNKITRSLYLVRPSDLQIEVVDEGEEFGGPVRRRARGRFKLSGTSYRFAVTDPKVERKYLAQGVGKTPIPEALVCLSLSEPYKGYAYKLIASVITRNGL